VEGKKLDELRAALELATEDELKHLTQILFCRKFNPIDYWRTPEPIEVQSKDWHLWVDEIDKRFRYLAADGLTVLRGRTQEITYRQTLIQVCLYLKIPYSEQMKTVDIESEVFLHLIGKAWQRLPIDEQKSLRARVVRSLARSKLPEPLPVQLQHDPLNIFIKGGSLVAIGSLIKPWLLQHIARQFALHFASYQTAKNVLIGGGTAAATYFENQLVLQTARQGMAVTAARYGTVRTVFSLLGPVLWGYFVADLGWRAIATNYGRIIPTIFTLAQIRLTRSECWGIIY
jgi:uncharacterized protein YaaW (UPF0174 family)